MAINVCPRLRDSACWRSCEITQPRTNFFAQLCRVIVLITLYSNSTSTLPLSNVPNNPNIVDPLPVPWYDSSRCVSASATFETPPASSSSDGEEGHSDNDVRSDEGNFVTQTVTGFLDFTTTVGNTVMVFTPEGGVKRKK